MEETKKSFKRISAKFDTFEGEAARSDLESDDVPSALGQIAIVSLIESHTIHHPLTHHQRDTVINNVLSQLLEPSKHHAMLGISSARKLSRNLQSCIKQSVDEEITKYSLENKHSSSILQPTNLLNIAGISRYAADFTEVSPIAKGGYGKVYKARHTLDGQDYAVKKVKLKKDWTHNDKILREVKCLAQLNHPHIVRYYNSWIEWNRGENQDDESEGMPSPTRSRDIEPHSRPPEGQNESGDNLTESASTNQQQKEIGLLFLQMELCMTTLKQWLENRNKTIADDKDLYAGVEDLTCRDIMRQVVDATHYIHSQGLLHRDIKPANIFLNEVAHGRLSAKLGDMGLIQYIALNTEPKLPTQQHLDGSLVDEELAVLSSDVGTRLYAAPEQLKEDIYSQKCDMFSLGVVLFEMYYPWKTKMERAQSLNCLRSHKQPESFMSQWPDQSLWVSKLTRDDPVLRPNCKEMLTSCVCADRRNETMNLEESVEEKRQ